MLKFAVDYCVLFLIFISLVDLGDAVIYSYEDVELRRIFPNEFPQDTIRRSGASDPEHLGRYGELKSYMLNPRSKLNSHFEELVCYNSSNKRLCKVDPERYSPEEENFFQSNDKVNYLDRRRVYCFMLLCFTEDELDRLVASF